MRRHKRKLKSGRRRVVAVLALLAAAALVAGFIEWDRWRNPLDNVLMLVNRQNTLREEYQPNRLRKVNVRFVESALAERRLMRADAAEALERLFELAERDGVRLYAVSGYRSYSTQEGIYKRRVREAGEEYANAYIARPGASEHQTGLAMDLSDDGTLEESFADTPAYAWLCEHAAECGFIVRYPKGAEEETGYAFEPWHIRYVGGEAKAVCASGLTLEAYLRLYHPALAFVDGTKKNWPYTTE